VTAPAGHDDVVVRPVTAAEIRPLRQRVLRPNQPESAAVFPGDDDATTTHLGAFRVGRLVGIASLYAEPRRGGPASAAGWRLRGMATAPDARRQGVGRALVEACLRLVADTGGGELWCNARTPAVGFYAGAGFEVASEEFDVPGIGPHVVMRRLVRPSAVQ
jgi:GNAT superfamily N-acetyltransferase